jgi:hypothetical protein
MTTGQRELQELRGLRYPFDAAADVVIEGGTENLSARMKELSFRGCFLETSATLKEHQHVRVKVFHAGEYFEATAQVMYVRHDGVGVLFGEIAPPLRKILQMWILNAMDQQAKSK